MAKQENLSDTLHPGTREWRTQRYAELWAAANPAQGEWERVQDEIWERIGEEENDALQGIEDRRIQSEMDA